MPLNDISVYILMCVMYFLNIVNISTEKVGTYQNTLWKSTLLSYIEVL